MSENYPSRARNQALARVFKDLRFVEQYGSGIERVKRSCLEHNIPAPIFEAISNGFKVTLYKELVEEKIDEGINEGEVLLLNFISNNPGQRIAHISRELNIPAKTLERWVRELRSIGKIEFKGAKKTGGYYIKG